MKKTFFGMFFALFALACSTASKKTAAAPAPQKSWQPDFSAGPPTIVYRTKKDFSDRVPVRLSADKTRVASYPAPTDLTDSKRPVALADGWLLDRAGAGPTTVFLRTSWADWAAQKTAPNPAEMLGPLLLEADPFVEMCDCGNRFQFKNAEAELRAIVESGQIAKCKKLK